MVWILLKSLGLQVWKVNFCISPTVNSITMSFDYNLSLVTARTRPWPGSGSLPRLIYLILIFRAWTSGAPLRLRDLNPNIFLHHRRCSERMFTHQSPWCAQYSHQTKRHDKTSLISKFSCWCSPQTSSPCLQLSCPASLSSFDLQTCLQLIQWIVIWSDAAFFHNLFHLCCHCSESNDGQPK